MPFDPTQPVRNRQYFGGTPVRNLGMQAWAVSIPLPEFSRMAEIANEARVGPNQVAQRDLDPRHAAGLARYILKACVNNARDHATQDPACEKGVASALNEFAKELDMQPAYALQPAVACLRQSDLVLVEEFAEGRDQKILAVPTNARLWVIDGQHRVWAVRAVNQFLRDVNAGVKYPEVAIGIQSDEYRFFLFGSASRIRTVDEGAAWRRVQYSFDSLDITVELHEPMSVEQERQIFHDLNNLTKRVEAGTAFAFDESNPVNRWIKHELIPNLLTEKLVVNKDQKNWDQDEGEFVRKDLIAVNAFLFLRKTSVKRAEPKHVVPETEAVAMEFWRSLLAVPGMGKKSAKNKVIVAQPVVQKALALIVNAYGMPKFRGRGSAKPPDGASVAIYKKVIAAIPKIDWGHDNKLWHAWDLENPEKDFPGIKPYLPNDIQKARGEFATVTGDRVRYGVKSNEISAALENLIRYHLSLPPRGGTSRRRSPR